MALRRSGVRIPQRREWSELGSRDIDGQASSRLSGSKGVNLFDRWGAERMGSNPAAVGSKAGAKTCFGNPLGSKFSATNLEHLAD